MKRPLPIVYGMHVIGSALVVPVTVGESYPEIVSPEESRRGSRTGCRCVHCGLLSFEAEEARCQGCGAPL